MHNFTPLSPQYHVMDSRVFILFVSQEDLFPASVIGKERRLMECAPRDQSSGLITVFTLTAAWFARLRFPPGGFSLSRFSPC